MSNIPNNIKKMWEEAAREAPSLRNEEPKPIKGPMPPLKDKKPVHVLKDKGYKYGAAKKTDNMHKDM